MEKLIAKREPIVKKYPFTTRSPQYYANRKLMESKTGQVFCNLHAHFSRQDKILVYGVDVVLK